MTATSEIVDDPTRFDATWLTGVLRAADVDATVRDVSVSPVGTGQMASCHRLDITYERGNGPHRLVAKLPSSDPDVRMRAAATYRTEVSFYRDLAPRLFLSTPRCWFAAASDDATSFTLLLDDMSPAVAGDQLAGCTPDEAREAAVCIAGLHAGTWNDAVLTDFDWLIPPMSALSDHLVPVIGEIADDFIARHDVGSTTSEVFSRFTDGFASWALDRSAPTTILHNDFRLDNILFAPPRSDLPAVTTVDWQSVTTGPPLRDVAFLLGTGLEPAVRADHERSIVSAYRDALLSLGAPDHDADRCWEDYRRGLFQGPLICLLGERAAAPTERGRRMFSVMAERSAAAIAELDALDLIETT